MTEFPELFEKIDRLDRELDVQAALIESLVDKLAWTEERVLKLELRRDASRSRNKNKKGPPTPSLPGGNAEHAAPTD